jgi:hypothetical protein
MKRIVLMLIVFMAFETVSYAEYYKCVTSDGKIIFTDSPPPDAKCEYKESIKSFSESPEYVNSMRDEADYQMEINEEKRAKEAEERRIKEEAAAERELEAKRLELKQRELDLKEREINAKVGQAPNEYMTVIQDTKINNVGKHSSGHEDHKKKEHDAKTRKDINEKNNVSGQAPKNKNEKNTVNIQQITPNQPPPPPKAKITQDIKPNY